METPQIDFDLYQKPQRRLSYIDLPLTHKPLIVNPNDDFVDSLLPDQNRNGLEKDILGELEMNNLRSYHPFFEIFIR